MVELDETLRHQKRMVIGQAGDAGAQLDVPGALGRCGDDQFGRGDDLPSGGMVLADPSLVVAELVEPFDQLEVARHRQGRVVAETMEGRQKHAEFQAALGHVVLLL